MIEAFTQWIETNAGISLVTQRKLLASLLIVVVIWMVRFLTLRVVFRRTEDVRIRYRWRKTVGYTSFGLAVMLVGALWLQAMQSVGTFLGLLSAGLTIALKDLVTGMAGWAFILWRRPLEVGDRIEIGQHRGDVIDVRVFQFTLMEIGNWVDSDQSTGRIIHIPNGRIFTDPLANYSKGFQFIWHEIPVLVTFESDWRAAKTILQRIADNHAEKFSTQAEEQVKRAARRFMIFYKNLTPIVYTTVKASGVMLTIRYLCQPRRRRGTEEAIWETVLDEFSQAENISLAYPTTRFYNRHLENAEQAETTSAPGNGDAS